MPRPGWRAKRVSFRPEIINDAITVAADDRHMSSPSTSAVPNATYGAERIGTAAELRDPELHAFLDYWNAKRGDRAMPARTEISPKELKAWLHRIHIYDVIDGGRDFRVRLMGTAIVQAFGADVTGTLLSAEVNPEIRGRIFRILRQVVSEKAPVAVKAEIAVSHNYPVNRLVGSLWLPLGKDAEVQHVIAQSIVTRRDT